MKNHSVGSVQPNGAGGRTWCGRLILYWKGRRRWLFMNGVPINGNDIGEEREPCTKCEAAREGHIRRKAAQESPEGRLQHEIRKTHDERRAETWCGRWVALEVDGAWRLRSGRPLRGAGGPCRACQAARAAAEARRKKRLQPPEPQTADG